MFTLGKGTPVSVKFFQESDRGVMDIGGLEALSKSLPRVEMQDGSIETVVARVLKTVFGVGQKSLENIVHQTAMLVAKSLRESEMNVFRDISRPDGSLFWNGIQDETMKNIFLSKRQSFSAIESFDALYKK